MLDVGFQNRPFIGSKVGKVSLFPLIVLDILFDDYFEFCCISTLECHHFLENMKDILLAIKRTPDFRVRSARPRGVNIGDVRIPHPHYHAHIKKCSSRYPIFHILRTRYSHVGAHFKARYLKMQFKNSIYFSLIQLIILNTS